MNRPRKRSITYRITDHQTLRRDLGKRLTQTRVDGEAPLRDLNPNQEEDGTLALVDLWASVADVLTFYQERIANEAYLRTATRAASIRRLTDLLGHLPAPGRAATTHLALTCAKNESALVPAGTAVQGKAVDGSKLIFETLHDLHARSDLDRLRLQTHRPHCFHGGDQTVRIQGTDHELHPGAPLLFVAPDDRHALRTLVRVEEDEDTNQTTLWWSTPLEKGLVQEATNLSMITFQARTRPLDHDVPLLTARLCIPQITPYAPPPPLPHPPVLDPPTLPDSDALHLQDNTLVPTEGDWILLLHTTPDGHTEYQAQRVRSALEEDIATRHRIGLVTRVQLDAPLRQGFPRNKTHIHLAPTSLPLAPVPDDPLPAQSQELPLAHRVEVPSGRSLLLEWSGPQGPRVIPVTCAMSRHHAAPGGSPQTTLVLREPLPASVPRTATVHGNVVGASHGEQQGPLHLGHSTPAPRQSFVIPLAPITFVPDPKAPQGVRSTLEVRIDGVRWKEVANLNLAGPDDHCFETRRNADGMDVVHFGDGTNGALPPAGTVEARFRHGLGTIGNAPSGALTSLPEPPLGIKAVTNPGAATGGVDPETPDASRAHAPRSARTLDRIVSLRDLEDAALAFTGVARAGTTWTGGRHGAQIALTVVGVGGATLDEGLCTALRRYLDARRDLHCPLVVRPHKVAVVQVHAELQIHPDFDDDRVLQDARSALVRAYQFERNRLGATVRLSDIYGVLQASPGVASVTVQAFCLDGQEDAEPSPRAPPDLALEPDQMASIRLDTIHLARKTT